MLFGNHVTLERLDPGRHGVSLWPAFREDETGELWDYMPYGPFGTGEEMVETYQAVASGPDPLFYAICRNPDGLAKGVASYLRITPDHGTIEIGHICLSPELQATTAATEALYLMMKHAFDDLGYRRLEWKCNALNDISRRSALRLGFTYEGIFRQHLVVKGHNRDTAWFAITDVHWPAIAKVLGAWLHPENFDDTGRQKTSLRDEMAKTTDALF